MRIQVNGGTPFAYAAAKETNTTAAQKNDCQ